MAQPLKSMVDRAVVEDLASRFAGVTAAFDAERFVAELMDELPNLELKPRIEAIARSLASGLDDDYRAALAVVVQVAQAEPAVGGFAAWPLCTFVEVFGIDDPEVSLPAMEHLTKRASCEFAIRPFLRDHWDAAYAQLDAFTASDDEAVRRLPSEGSRPRLPWGMRVRRLIEDPLPGLALVERLRDDPSETVRRSVANHLNDVAKDHPSLVVGTAARWLGEIPDIDTQMVSHALRTLVKQGNAGALETLGFTTEPKVAVDAFTISPAAVGMGEAIELEATLASSGSKTQRLVVDFVVHHVNASGVTSPKVFKWTTLDLDPHERVTVRKRRLIQQASTRTYRSGVHRVELQVAGVVMAESQFDVTV